MSGEGEYKKVLTIAGSDSGGGAGVQADLKTFGALGCYGMSVITAITAQNTCEVRSIHEVPVAMVKDQLEAVLEDIGVDVVKIGMLFSAKVVEVVAETLKRYGVKRIVLDPVMVAKSGNRLLSEEAREGLMGRLMPLASVVTPNLPEVVELCGVEVESMEGYEKSARKLHEMGAKAVLIKGGHSEGLEVRDLFSWRGGEAQEWFKSERVMTRNTHGTGCTLSSAIAAYMAMGEGVRDAIEHGRVYLLRALEEGAGYKLGRGYGPVKHFCKQ